MSLFRNLIFPHFFVTMFKNVTKFITYGFFLIYALDFKSERISHLNPGSQIDVDLSFIVRTVSRHCGPDAGFSIDMFLARGLKRHEEILRYIASICPPTSFLPIAGREVWPAAADVVILDSDLDVASPADLVREKMKHCLSTTHNKPCVVFIHTETLKATAGDVLSFLRAYKDMKIILISSSNQDKCVPWWSVRHDESSDEFPAVRSLLDHSRMLEWFTENPCMQHPKLRPLPLGPKFRISTPFFGEDVSKKRAEYVELAVKASVQNGTIRRAGIVLRLDVHTNDNPFYAPHSKVRSMYLPYVRHIALSLGVNNELGNVETNDYVSELQTTSHVWSPPGRGIDSHRTWESLLCGSIPIVLDSPLRAAYEGLNVMSLKSFTDLTADSVIESASQTTSQIHGVNIFSPLFCFFWIREIEKATMELK